MTLVPEIYDQIRATAERRARLDARPRRSGRRWRRVAGSLIIVVSTLVVAAVVAVFVIDGHHISGHNAAGVPVPSAPPKPWGKLNAQANKQTKRHDSACRRQRLTRPPLFRDDAPSPDLSSALAVLRQPAPAGQQVSPASLRRVLGGALGQVARGIYVRYARRGQMNGITYYLVPAANINQVRAAPDRCYSEQLAAFRQDAARLPAAQRPAAIRYETSRLQAQRTVASHPAGICLIHAGAGGTGVGPCTNAISLQQSAPSHGFGSDGNDHATVTALIVPDPVATVTARYGAQTYPGRVPHPLTVTQRARQNVVIFYLRGAWDPPSSLTYRSTDGTVVWSSARHQTTSP
jgi:hypothetical protein